MSSIEQMKVSYTPDGDTVRCLRLVNGGLVEVRVRLAYIDAPEMAQEPWGTRARAYLRSLLRQLEPVEVRIYGQDHYGRLIGEMTRLRDGGLIGLRLVQNGYVTLRGCPRERREYYAALEIAQCRRLGIWSVPGLQQTPWLYRGEVS